jgi:hypothetical protein
MLSPGTGILSIARCLFALLPKSPLLLDNHTLIDPVAAKYTRDHPEYASERRREKAWHPLQVLTCRLSKSPLYSPILEYRQRLLEHVLVRLATGLKAIMNELTAREVTSRMRPI